jgi:hypothetical protein
MIRVYVACILLQAIGAAASQYQCVFCMPGKYKSVIANDACLECPVNTYMNYSGADDRSDCFACPPNTQSIDGSQLMTDCLCNPGFFGPPGGPCSPCEKKKYADVKGQTACTACPSFTDSAVQSDAITDCECVAGYTGPNGGTCEMCAEHTYKTAIGPQACTACVANTMTLGLGKTAESACVCTPGYTAGVGPEGCTSCSAGKYKVDPGPDACTNCGVHTYSTAVAATAPETCGNCPENTVSAVGSGVITACTCNTGYTGADGNACTACETGQWKDAIGSAVCTDCGLGKFSGMPAAKTALTCTTCPENSYTKLLGNDVLEDCECNAGFTGLNGGHCSACPAGKYKIISGSSDCISCDADMYSTAVASTTGVTCQACPTSSQSPQGSSAKAACVCNMGYTGVGGSAAPYTCTACEAGTFKDATGPATCTNCAEDKYSTEGAAVSVATCLGCAANMQSLPGSNEVIDCKCNKGYTGNDGTTCTACIAGTYKTSVGSATCTNCAANKYSIKEANPANDCDSCPSFAQSPEGSNELIDCQCNAGYSGLDGGTCNACGSGKFKSSVGSAICSECTANHYQPLIAQTSATVCNYCGENSLSPPGNSLQVDCNCAPGYTGANGESCTACYMGKYKKFLGPDECTLCPNKTYSSRTAQTSILTCDACPDFSQSHMGSTKRSDCHCLFGYYTENFGKENSECAACAKGTYNDKLNAEACSKCTAGKYSSDTTATGEETCKTCEFGFSAEGQSQCDACPSNATALRGSAVVTDCKCNPGYTGADGDTCEHCYPGKFKAVFGSMQCTDCPINTYSPDLARTIRNDCRNCLTNSESLAGSDSRDDCKCSVGWTSAIAGVDGEICEACIAGKFKDDIGHAACQLCPSNTYVDTTSSTSVTNCIDCFPYSEAAEGSDALDDCRCVGGYERQTGL